MGWLIALAVLIAIGCLPLGINGIYDSSGPVAELLIGPIRYRLYPRKRKKKAQPSPEAQSASSKGDSPAKQEKKGGKLSDFLPLLRVATDFLGDLRRKIRVKQLKMHLCMAGSDPCELGINYGRAWAAVGNIMPQLERIFVIQKRDVQVHCDFTGNQTTISLQVAVTITIGRLLGLVVRYGWRALKEYLKIMNKRKGGTVK